MNNNYIITSIAIIIAIAIASPTIVDFIKIIVKELTNV